MAVIRVNQIPFHVTKRNVAPNDLAIVKLLLLDELILPNFWVISFKMVSIKSSIFSGHLKNVFLCYKFTIEIPQSLRNTLNVSFMRP